MTQQEALDLQTQIKHERPDCVVVARRKIEWDGSEWWYVQVENPQKQLLAIVLRREQWHEVLSRTV